MASGVVEFVAKPVDPGPAAGKGRAGENLNAILTEDLPIHDWYRFVLSFPPHLVRKYLTAFSVNLTDTVLDPFCGTGTTLVECRKQGVGSLGVEAHPLAVLASQVKTNWDLPVAELKEVLREILRRADRAMTKAGMDASSMVATMLAESPVDYGGLNEDQIKLIPEGFVSPKPLKRLLLLREAIDQAANRRTAPLRDFFRLAMCHVIVNGAGNFAFGPEIYRTKAKVDYDALEHFGLHAGRMIHQLESLRASSRRFAPCAVVQGDARELNGVEPQSVDFLISSPPYPNEKDYTRITRVESVLLGLIGDRKQLREVKHSLLRSNTRNVFVSDDDGDWVKDFPSITAICRAIEKRREELGKTSGFERLYHRVVAHYFGGMARHFSVLRGKLKPKARCAYVVGDQLSFLLVPIPTARLLSEIAATHGFKTLGCDLWRTRLGTKSGTRVREEVLILEKQ